MAALGSKPRNGKYVEHVVASCNPVRRAKCVTGPDDWREGAVQLPSGMPSFPAGTAQATVQV